MRIPTLLVCLACLLPCGAAEPLRTNARLPEDRITLKNEEGGKTSIDALFKSDEVISSVVQGNWIRTQHLVTYEILGEAHPDLGKKLKFLCLDSNPTVESGIRMKKIPWPFRGGSMTFRLSRDESCAYMPYFNITGYQPLLREKQ